MIKSRKPIQCFKAIALCVCAVLPQYGWSACPSIPTATRFEISGAEVTDLQTGLIWKRCSEGQSWSGSTCTGNAATYSHEQALAQAKTQNSTGSASGWRLPHVKELSRLADRGCNLPTIDSTAFPGTPSTSYWSSSSYVSNTGLAWDVYFGNGDVGRNGGRYYYGAVRLVRSTQ